MDWQIDVCTDSNVCPAPFPAVLLFPEWQNMILLQDEASMVMSSEGDYSCWPLSPCSKKLFWNMFNIFQLSVERLLNVWTYFSIAFAWHSISKCPQPSAHGIASNDACHVVLAASGSLLVSPLCIYMWNHVDLVDLHQIYTIRSDQIWSDLMVSRIEHGHSMWSCRV